MCEIPAPTKGSEGRRNKLQRKLGSAGLGILMNNMCTSDNAPMFDIDSDHGGCKRTRRSTTAVLGRSRGQHND